jgi:hypothetical protein
MGTAALKIEFCVHISKLAGLLALAGIASARSILVGSARSSNQNILGFGDFLG